MQCSHKLALAGFQSKAVPNLLCNIMRRGVASSTGKTEAVAAETTVKQPTVSSPNEETPYQPPTSTLGGVHKVSNLERRFLVWTKKYKTVDEVPAYVSRDTMEKSRNIIRIKTNLAIIGLVVIGAFLAAWSGKNAAGQGESLQKKNLEWHKSYNEEKNKQEKT